MSRFALSPQDVRVLQGVMLAMSPLLLVGASVYGVHRGISLGIRTVFGGRRRKQRQAQALQRIREESQRNKEETRHLLALGFSSLISEDFERANEALQKAMQIETTHILNHRLLNRYYPAAHFFCGRLFLALEDWAPAVEHFDTCIRYLTTAPTPQDPGYHRYLGIVIGDFIGDDTATDDQCCQAALRYMVRSCEEVGVRVADAQSFAAYARLQVATASNRPTTPEAMQALDRALADAVTAAVADPSNPRPVMIAAWCHFHRGLRREGAAGVTVLPEELQQALRDLDAAERLALAAEDSIAQLVAAEQAANGDDDGSSDDGDAAVRAPGASGVSVAELYSLRAQVLNALGRFEVAAEALRKAREMDADVPHSDLDRTQEEPRLGLLVPWPNATNSAHEPPLVTTPRGSPTWRGPAGLQQEQPPHRHSFMTQRVAALHTCLHCEHKIMSITKALKCTDCGAFAHIKCGPDIPNAIIGH